jgi:hypothetical protein
MKLSELPEKPCIAIVRLEDSTVNPAVLFQVVLDPARVSPSGEMIRFNATGANGKAESEIHGWKQISKIVLVEILEVL